MKTLAALLVACGVFAVADARPRVIQESARIANPNPAYDQFAGDIALDGDDAFITLRNFVAHEEEDPYDDESHTQIYLFRRVAGTWTPVRVVSEATNYYYLWPNGLAAKGGVAAFVNPLRIFEKRNGNWVQANVTGVETDMPGDSVSIDGLKVLYGGSSGPFQGALYEKDAAGTWNRTARMVGEYRGGDDEYQGRDVGISGIHAIVMSPYSEEEPVYPTPNVAVFRDWGPGTGWYQEFTIANSVERPLGDTTTILNVEIFISGSDKTGTFVFRPTNTSTWAEGSRLQPVDSYMGGGVTHYIRATDRFVLQNSYNADRDARVINVFTKDANGVYDHAATLVASAGVSLGAFAICGRRVLASCGDEVCAFELPASLAQPAVIQETFAGSTPNAWTLSAGSQFTIVQSGASRVLRQAETTSTATHTATLTASNWSNQSIQADVKPTAFNGNDRWVGLAARYRDAGNHYYVTLRSSGKVMLRKIVNGAVSTIASAPLPVALNRTYRLRLEAIGTRIRVYANGLPLLDADDSSLASGRAALLTYRAAAEFDNVIVSPTPTATLWAQGGPERSMEYDWILSGPGQWSIGGATEAQYSQTSVAGDARALIGTPTDAQTMDIRARATTFAGTGTGDRWFGTNVRYSDDYNYYYLTVRSNGTVSLRKRVNGANIVLGTVNMPVTVGQWYQLRLDAVGTQLRAFVDGTLRMEVTDSSHPRGKTGIVTYRTAAQFTRYRAIQP